MKIDAARILAAKRLKEMTDDPIVLELVIMDERTEEYAFGFLFFYDSKAHLESGDFLDGLAGNGPLLVLHSGEVIPLPTSQPVEVSFAAYR